MKAPEFWMRGQGGLVAPLLSPFGQAFGLIGNMRCRLARPWRSPVPVLCVGNVVAGGAGKTPVALDLAARLQTMGRAVAFLSRGYGGTEIGPHRVDSTADTADRVGDEPLLLGRQATTWVARNRVAGARAASTHADIIVMDDGFQNPSLVKNASVLVVDGGYGIGNGYLLPAGPLREPLGHALYRTDCVVIVGEDRSEAGRMISAITPELPILRARIIPGAETNRLSGKKIIAFAGIGRPEKFYRTLSDAGCNLVATRCFADHHPYSTPEIARLKNLAADHNGVLVTTEKDMVRIPEDQRAGIEVLTITLQWDDEAPLTSLLERLS